MTHWYAVHTKGSRTWWCLTCVVPIGKVEDYTRAVEILDELMRKHERQSDLIQTTLFADEEQKNG